MSLFDDYNRATQAAMLREHSDHMRAHFLRIEIANLESRLREARREYEPIAHLLMSRSEMMEDDRVYKD